METPVCDPGRAADGRRVQDGKREQNELLDAIRVVLREELTGVSFSKNNVQPEQAGDVDADVLGFLLSLQEGDETT